MSHPTLFLSLNKYSLQPAFLFSNSQLENDLGKTKLVKVVRYCMRLHYRSSSIGTASPVLLGLLAPTIVLAIGLSKVARCVSKRKTCFEDQFVWTVQVSGIKKKQENSWTKDQINILVVFTKFRNKKYPQQFVINRISILIWTKMLIFC